MKRIVALLIILSICYFLLQMAFQFLGTGHTTTYEINNEKTFKIKEILTQNTKHEKNNYYFEITVNDTVFGLQTFQNLSRVTKAIKDIKYFKNSNYECILPILKNGTSFTDMICLKDQIYYYYNSISGKDPELDKFAETIDLKKYSNEFIELKNNGNLYVYDNLAKNHYVVLENYKGIYSINDKTPLKKINIFNSETYEKSISNIVSKYYLVADYSKQYDFHEFILVNLENNTTSKIVSNSEISLNSYVQGVVDNKVYIMDKTNKKQYEIDVKNKEVNLIGSESIGAKIYKNNEFVNYNIYDAINEELKFDEYSTDNKLNDITYSRVDKVGFKLSGYYYIYEKVNKIYKVYRVNVQNTNLRTFIFETNDIDNIIYKDNYIYYTNGLELSYFSELTNIKTIAKYKDLEFNKSLKMFVYIK